MCIRDRNRPGEAFIFVTSESRDEAALWSSKGKEQRMHDLFSAGGMEIDLPTPDELAGTNVVERSDDGSPQTTFRSN